MVTTAETGIQGEKIAALHLEACGYDVLERNVRFGKYEIDIVAFDRVRAMMVFVEVKTRRRFHPLYPIQTAVNPRKRRALTEAIARWCNVHEYDGPGRMDILCVASHKIVQHIVDAGADFF
jgi:putative endonuclease